MVGSAGSGAGGNKGSGEYAVVWKHMVRDAAPDTSVKSLVRRLLISAAMLAIDTGESFTLVDPTRTLCNLFEASDYLSSAVPSVPCTVRANVLVEVRVGTKWQTGIVRSVDHARGQFTVKLVHTASQIVCSTNAHTWRRVSDDASDLDRIVVRHLKRPRDGVSV